MQTKSKLKAHALVSTETESISCMSSSPLLLLMAPRMSSSEKASSHQIFYIDASARESSKTVMLLLLLGGGILIACKVIHSPSLRIFKEFIGIYYFFELLFGPWISFVAIRMILFGTLFEPFLDLILCSVLLDAQDLVRIGNFKFCYGAETEE